MAVLEAVCTKHNIDINALYGDLSKKDREKILYGVPGTFELTYITKIDENRTHKSKYE